MGPVLMELTGQRGMKTREPTTRNTSVAMRGNTGRNWLTKIIPRGRAASAGA